MNYSKKSIVDKHKTLVSTPKKLSTKLLVNAFKVFIFLIIIGISAIGFLGLGAIKGILDGAPSVEELDITPVGYSTTIYDSDGNEIEKLSSVGANRVQVTIDQIPLCLQYAFIDIEDERFETHNGIDFKGMLRAGVEFITSGGSETQGASTITQQLLKNNVFENGGRENSTGALVKRKIQEQYLALELEKTVSKSIILENYLNTLFLASNCYGVQSASQRYFGKDVWDLTISESAVIAAITQNPESNNPIRFPENNAKRRLTALNKMLEKEHITEEEYNEAINDDVYSRIQSVNIQTDSSVIYSYYNDELIKQVLSDLQTELGYTYTQAQKKLYTGGLSIYSTQDSQIQAICDEEIANPENYPANVYYSFDWYWTVQHADGTKENYSNYSINYLNRILRKNAEFKIIFSSLEEAKACIEDFKTEYLKEDDIVLGENTYFTLQPQVSFSVIDQRTGYVKALVGGREKETSLSLNRATNSTRQPGSCFKILASFAPALEAGKTLATVYDDAPFNYSTGRAVNNWWQDGYKGLNSIRFAIEKSANIIAVKCITEITPAFSYDYLLDFGLTSIVKSRELKDGTIVSDLNQATALGGITDGVINVEMCNAYATIANGGIHTDLVYYTKVTDANGRILLEKEPETKRVLKESTAWLLTNAMHDVVTSGTGTAANISGQYVAGKTGTTSNSYDLWFAGYSNYLTAAIWTGFDENAPINKLLQNEGYHTRLWSKIMTRVHSDKGYAYSAPDDCDDIVTAKICSKCGYLAEEGVCDQDPESSKIKEEYFAAGTVPTEKCKCHRKYTICNASGKLANDNCPSSQCTVKVYRYRFLGNEGTTQDSQFEIPASLANSTCIIH